jgi:phosphosulfolactate synthase
VPHDGHFRSSFVPHSMQNLAPAGFWAPQLEQVVTYELSQPRSCLLQVRLITQEGGLTSAVVPDFLDLPARPPKPRETGLTHVIDTGLSPHEAEGLMQTGAAYIDLVRLGFGSAYVTGALREKIDLYRERGVPVALGGTLTELAWLQKRVDGLRSWLKELGIEHVEVSSGSVPIPSADKADLIRDLSADFTVFAEVGEKDPAAIIAPYRWVEMIEEALEAGASKVVCEGRASGDAGMYRPDGEARTGLIDEIVHRVDFHRLIFEAPKRHQQVWFIEHMGPEVNLGNIRPDDVIPLETLRLGLRADTLHLFHSGE